MRFISNFLGFQQVNEATLDSTKEGINYILSRNGRLAIDRFGITEDMTLSYSRKRPSANTEVLWLKPSSIQKIKFSELKSKLGISGSLIDELMIYQTSSKLFPWAVAKKGSRTTMIRQLDKVGAAKRGEHFRETAFIITLAIEAWAEKRVELRISSNRGFIKMAYNNDGTSQISDDERGAFRHEYDTFMSENIQAVNAMRDQCRKLIAYLGEDIKNVSYVIKNTTDLLINQVAATYLKDESTAKGTGKFATIPVDDDYGIIDLPTRLSLAKWNPSDIWIIFDGYEWTMEDFDKYESLGDIEEEEYESNSDIDDLNSFLMDSILNNKGLIGVSLKQGSNVGSLSIVNADPKKAIHKYDGYEMSNDKKTVTINFSYKFGKKSKFFGGSEIQCRTFDRTTNSSVSLEVKGSKKAKHMSGKAGSILESIMGPKFFKIKEFIRTSTDKEEIAELLDKERFRFKDRDLQEIFYDDISTGTIKTPDQNSRMQSIIILEWLESMPQIEANKVISKIVSFAKSESTWSAPHLLVK